jgi:VNT family MFS transporter (synaptic vesicle glycoprotein 2)
MYKYNLILNIRLKLSLIFRVMAAALSLTMGRLGALVGNLMFGYLIDLACVVPVILFAAFLFGKYFFLFYLLIV